MIHIHAAMNEILLASRVPYGHGVLVTFKTPLPCDVRLANLSFVPRALSFCQKQTQ